MKSKTLILIISGAVLAFCCIIILIIGAIFGFSGNKNSSDNTNKSGTITTGKSTKAATLVDCTYQSNDPVTKNPTYKTTIYSGVLVNNSYKDLIDTGVRSFSQADYLDKTKLTSDLIMRIEMASGGSMTPTTVGIDFQICNADNKTTYVGFINPSSSNTAAIIHYLNQKKMPETTGTYRVDAVLELNGKKQLIDRLENIIITK
ncbi:MAG: hypothetical protein WCJ58_06740 [bacterium]